MGSPAVPALTWVGWMSLDPPAAPRPTPPSTRSKGGSAALVCVGWIPPPAQRAWGCPGLRRPRPPAAAGVRPAGPGGAGPPLPRSQAQSRRGEARAGA
jgi:hypothetical protein